MGRTRLLLVLIAAAAALRLWMQMAALPPYAGLDEIYHVARLAFVAREGRNPSMSEPSVPAYLAASIEGSPAALPAFGVIGEKWPEVVKTRPVLAPDHIDPGSYAGTNYEAQQPSIYYTIAAPLVRLLPHRTALGELRLWRCFSVLCALVVVLATALIAQRWFGPTGLLAAAVVFSMPTWLTLVVRASNDALACALLAVACLISLHHPRVWIAEAVAWALALAVKLYTWPVAVILPFVWREQRAPRRRWLTVSGAAIISVALTVFDLARRTNNPLGLFAFDTVRGTTGSLGQIDFASMLRIIVASFAWTSGQHWNALRPLAIALYLGPVVACVVVYARRSKRTLGLCAIAALAFALAQAVNAAGYIRRALAEGATLPAGGKEGWYWYVLAPLAIALIAVCPRVVVALLLAWIVGWDVLIHEGALFQDFAGLTHANGGDALIRWGPRALPFTYGSLTRVAVGPAAAALPLLRVLELVLLAAATFIASRRATARVTARARIP